MLEETRILSQVDLIKALKELNSKLCTEKGDDVIAALIKASFVGEIEVLDLSNMRISMIGVRMLSQTNKLTSLKVLNLGWNSGIGDEEFIMLAQAPWFEQIESLNMQCTDITCKGLQALEQKGTLKALNSLDLSNNKRIEDRVVATLAKTPFINNLESLSFRSTRITARGIEKLAKSCSFKALKVLDIGWNLYLEDAGLEALAQAPWAGQLESLFVDTTDITAVGIAALSQPETFKALTVLDVAKNTIGDQGIEQLLKAPFAHTLESLNLECTGITAVGVKVLSKAGIFMPLKTLNLAGNLLDDEVVKALSESSFAPYLESLDLSSGFNFLSDTFLGITNLGIEVLSQPNIFIALKELNLAENTHIGDASIIALSQAPFAATLESLNLSGTGITEAGVKVLSESGVFRALKILNY